MSRGISLDFLNIALEEATDAASLNAGQDLSELGVEVDMDSSFLDSDIIKNEADSLALEDRVNDMLNLIRVLTKEKAMSKTLALEAERLVPGFIKTSIDYYTDAPSKTLYSVSLEDLSNSMKGLIAAIAVATIALIYKLIKWIFGSKSSSGESSSSTGLKSSGTTSSGIKNTISRNDFKQAEADLTVTKENLKESTNVITVTNEITHEIDVVLKDENLHVYLGSDYSKVPRREDDSVDYDRLTRVKNLDHYAELVTDPKNKMMPPRRMAAVENFMYPTELTTDIMLKGEFTKLVTSVIRQLPYYVADLAISSEAVYSTYKELLKSDLKYTEKSTNDLHIANLQKIKNILDKEHVFKVSGGEYTPAALMIHMNLQVASMKDDNTRKRHSLTNLVNGFYVNREVGELEDGVNECTNLLRICQNKVLPILNDIKGAPINSPAIAGEGALVPERGYALFADLNKRLLMNTRDVSALIQIVMKYIDIREETMYSLVGVIDILVVSIYDRTRLVKSEISDAMVVRVASAQKALGNVKKPKTFKF